MTTSLTDRFAALQAERDRTWSPEQLERNASQRRVLVERHDPAALPKVGDPVGPFTLIDQDGGELTRDEILADGSAVLVFFRFGGCPACNIALPYYNETLLPQLQERGIRLIAVSAQVPVDPELVGRHDLGFTVAGDPDYALARALSITFLPEDQPAIVPGQNWIGATLGTNSYEIDKPAVLVLDQDSRIRFLDVSPDWLKRTESEAILAALPHEATRTVETAAR
ncbi:alkyl hydroperoxide reductase/ Thiol specific antioxidant/ Mal allergen [Novosphingobium sp. Rr 2-17]|uniref:peroxiredoxin-like family protein n=1 Tax=Novosphingobium sp. Rr 2-17 TaxID=555793 RepID=UPI0002698F07|nr:peroxiredoxin-like family protein [Novosphingobium sp. Rr 2-17]EIZ78157.1 alkyl hydroperoxide reductase/ Thiol specific antioxidant/ Mal allergen [Novosphingobium sp. Rr 2-17]